MRISGNIQTHQESAISLEKARSGMVLSRDLMSTRGELLLSKDHKLTESMITQIKNFDQLGGRLIAYIYDRK
jgi:hypothetical protein